MARPSRRWLPVDQWTLVVATRQSPPEWPEPPTSPEPDEPEPDEPEPDEPEPDEPEPELDEPEPEPEPEPEEPEPESPSGPSRTSRSPSVVVDPDRSPVRSRRSRVESSAPESGSGRAGTGVVRARSWVGRVRSRRDRVADRPEPSPAIVGSVVDGRWTSSTWSRWSRSSRSWTVVDVVVDVRRRWSTVAAAPSTGGGRSAEPDLAALPVAVEQLPEPEHARRRRRRRPGSSPPHRAADPRAAAPSGRPTGAAPRIWRIGTAAPGSRARRRGARPDNHSRRPVGGGGVDVPDPAVGHASSLPVGGAVTPARWSYDQRASPHVQWSSAPDREDRRGNERAVGDRRPRKEATCAQWSPGVPASSGRTCASGSSPTAGTSGASTRSRRTTTSPRRRPTSPASAASAASRSSAATWPRWRCARCSATPTSSCTSPPSPVCGRASVPGSPAATATTCSPPSACSRRRSTPAARASCWRRRRRCTATRPSYPCPETAPLRPRSPYAVTKRACEDLGDVYRQLGLDVVALRYFTVYGPRQRPDMAVRRLCEAVDGRSAVRAVRRRRPRPRLHPRRRRRRRHRAGGDRRRPGRGAQRRRRRARRR